VLYILSIAPTKLPAGPQVQGEMTMHTVNIVSRWDPSSVLFTFQAADGRGVTAAEAEAA
jgi:hypothetical protein